MEQEQHGPAETILQSLLGYSDHLYHNRPGVVVPDAGSLVGVRWFPVTHRLEGEQKIVYRIDKVGRRTREQRMGSLREDDNAVMNGAREPVAHYRPAGIFPEVAAWMYGRVAEVWKLDNEFSARWASFAFAQEHRDMKVVLAAFMLCQSRKGDPERENGEILFYDEDYRDVGEAMCLCRQQGSRRPSMTDNPKMLLRIREALVQDAVAEINRELGFTRSMRRPFLGRWPRVAEKWLRHREQNPRALKRLVERGFRTSVMRLAQTIQYKPDSARFYEILRWKQKQAKDGRREVALGLDVAAADSWEGLSEAQICERIVEDKPSYKVLVSKVPTSVGMTRAVMAAAIEAGALSDKDLVIATPTLEQLGLLEVQDVKERWQEALKRSEDQRAANIAKNVRSKKAREGLQEAADTAVKKAVEEVVKGLRIYLFVDVSGSMSGSIVRAKGLLERFVQGFPLEQLHVATFNTVGREVTIKHASAAGVNAAFRGVSAGGGTSHGRAVRALVQHPPKPDEDSLFIFVGDQEESGDFAAEVQMSGLRPMAFGFLEVRKARGYSAAVTDTAARLGVPCFRIDPDTFDDPYAIPRTIRALVASTPVGTVSTGPLPRRQTLVEQILKTELLKKPAWAVA